MKNNWNINGMYIDASDKVRCHLVFDVEMKDEIKAFNASERLRDFWEFALKDPICRAKFEAANPQGFRVLDVDDMGELVGIE